MPHVITQSCCSDGSCVFACPVNCIQPTPDDPDFLSAEMLHVDPTTCVDCGACVTACPVGAIKPHQRLSEDEQVFRLINADYFDVPRRQTLLAIPPAPLTVRRREPLRVAIVGSGPAAMYAADEVLTVPGASVDVYERLAEPYGLARFGVAPDHRRTRNVSRQLDVIASQPGFRLHTGVEVGRDISAEQLLQTHHAVIYAVGASADKPLDVPGMGLPGSAPATEFVAWYNGHPDAAGRDYDLSHERAIVIGNGNVALDVARLLTIDPDALVSTPIAPAALSALRRSRIRDVVIVGRRGPAQSSFTLPELVGLGATPGVTIAARPDELSAVGPTGDGFDGEAGRKLSLLRGVDDADAPLAEGERRITFRYGLTPAQVLGRDRVTGAEFARGTVDADGALTLTGERETIDAGLVLTSIGYRGVPVAGLPFDAAAGVIPNDRGRVDSVPGSYVAGWIKRGPSGFIGTNRSCAQETVQRLIEDFNAGALRLALPAAARSAGRQRRQKRQLARLR